MKSLSNTFRHAQATGSPNRSRIGPAVVALVALAITAPWSTASASADITGVWFNDTKEAAIELKPCGDGMCGHVVWLRRPISRKTGKPQRDANNPTPSQRNRPICGMKIISDAQPKSDGSWDSGQIYNPKVGKTYKVAIEKLGADSLRVTGYLGARLFGRSFDWKRAPAKLSRC